MHQQSLTIYLTLATLLTPIVGFCQPAKDLGDIVKEAWEPGKEVPIPVSLSGFSGEVANVIRFDLYVQGFEFVKPEDADLQISGSNAGSVKGRVNAGVETLLVRNYSGASLRRQAHAFTDEIVGLVRGGAPIGLTRIACKVDKGNNAEIYVSDFDGYGAKSITSADKTLAKSPAWVPGQPVLFYTSMIKRHMKIVRDNIMTGKRVVFAEHGGSNLMPAVSPDGTKVAMVLSRSGWPELYVANIDGSGLKQLTKSKDEESSPTWSSDGRWICFATKIGGRRSLAKVSPTGGAVQRLSVGFSNPTEPDWSPDGEWLAFTTAYKGGFTICVVPAEGGTATPLVSGEDPSWAPNSRTLVYNRRAGGRSTLSLLDVPTKQFKDVPRISGSNNSQPAWAR